MFLDAAELEPGTRLEVDVCIVGAGAAGIALARELLATGREIVVLESGGFAYEEAVQQRYVGRAVGTILGEGNGYLTASRLAYFGGTTNHWHGYCRPLDPEDFAVRDWVPDSGWPLDRSQLDPYYARACSLAEVLPFDYDPETIASADARSSGRPRLLADDDAFETSFFHLSRPVRFGSRYREELATARNLRVVLHAAVTSLTADAAGRHVEAVEVAGPGRRLSVAARAVVLAAGGIENPRLLLASRDVVPQGLGNEHDLVGRCFMDHPAVAVGHVVLPYRRILMDLYSPQLRPRVPHEIRGALRLSPSWQRARGALNAVVLFDDLATPPQWPALAPEVAALATDVLQLDGGYPDPAVGTQYFGALDLVGEQAPDPGNRVTLSEERDDLAVPRVRLEWRFGEHDEASLRAAAAELVRGLGARLHGRVRSLIAHEGLWERTRWSNHHMGTTRMASTPERGVVDADCRLHGVDNLWVAGSSVFPTSGCSNPTLTLLALAVRLADHLAERLAR
jgi:choline dehydrogenase-like flavoprotein